MCVGAFFRKSSFQYMCLFIDIRSGSFKVQLYVDAFSLASSLSNHSEGVTGKNPQIVMCLDFIN